MYKYVLINDGVLQNYEQGIDRIADLKLLEERTSDLNVSMPNN